MQTYQLQVIYSAAPDGDLGGTDVDTQVVAEAPIDAVSLPYEHTALKGVFVDNDLRCHDLTKGGHCPVR